mmetsp:Transcript_29843/g.68765  ORF Transcript_29843/g.68765 Transcript_29843/m.68765 type:complete len:402 (+) Transcript_29843:1-1206(+)
MRAEKKWLDKFPCEADEYESRFNSVVSVFWQHIVFDPARGNLSRICQAFPDRNRALPGVDLDGLTGILFPKEEAVQIYKGDLDPRSMKPRPQEGLSKLERQYLLQKMRAKKAELHDYQFQMKLQADKERHAAARAANSQLMDAAPVQADGQGPSMQLDTSTEREEATAKVVVPQTGDDRAKPSFARPLPGDLQAIVDVLEHPASPDDADGRKDQDKENDLRMAPEEAPPLTGATPPRLSPRKRPRTAVAATSQQGSSNPFAKRSKASSLHPLQERRPSAVTEIERQWRERQPEEITEDPPSPARKAVETEVHPLGGFAAQEAVRAVLAHKRGIEYEAVEEQFDRGKIAFFMQGGTKARAGQAALKSGVAAALAAVHADKDGRAQANQPRRPNLNAKIFMRR